MADDVAGSRYTVEMQNENEYNINKRSRYYHSMMDQIVDGRDEGARCHSRVDLHLIEKERHLSLIHISYLKQLIERTLE